MTDVLQVVTRSAPSELVVTTSHAATQTLTVTTSAPAELSVQVAGVPGPAGPAGPPRPPFDQNFTLASDRWVCEHNLGVRGVVTCYAPGGGVIFGHIEENNAVRTIVSWAFPMTGSISIIP
jgi:hypothetical protein